MKPLTLRARCEREACRAVITIEPASAGETSSACPRCGDAVRWRVDDALWRERAVTSCPRCGGVEFFVRRDFPQRLGLSVVILAAVASCVLLYRQQMLWAWGVLGAAVVVDALLYLVTGVVTVCYRCRTELRGVVYNPDHHGFDLARAEKYG